MKNKNTVPLNKPGLIARLGAGIFLFAFALVIYLPSFTGPFHFDDLRAVVDNPEVHIRDLKPAILFRAAFQNGLQNRPLSNLSLALNYYFGQLNPVGYHVVNFLFFCLTALGLWFLLERLFVSMGFEPVRSGLAAWLSALLWAAHPLNTQAVTYIVQRHASFAGAFSIWSIFFFHLGLEAKKRRALFYSLCALCGICALLCKETALVLPALIFLYKIYFFDELKPGWLRRNAKWMIALAVFYTLGAAAVFRPAMLAHIRLDFVGNHVSAWGKFLSAPRSLFWYLYLILFPFPQFLSLIHEFTLSTGWFHPFTTVVSWAAFLAVVLIALARARKWRIFSFAVLWYLGSLAVEAMPLPIDIVNEHRLYLALLSLLVPACAWPVLTGKSLKLVLPWAMVVALFFGSFTFSRNRVWASEASLWKDVLQKAPKIGRAWSDYCSTLIKANEIKKAAAACSVAVSVDPKEAESHGNLGICFFQTGDFAHAEKELAQSITLNPQYALGYFNLGLVKTAQGDWPDGRALFLKAEQTGLMNPDAYFNIGLVFEKIGEKENALKAFERALGLRPEWSDARFKVVAGLAEHGNCQDAVRLIESAPVQDPRFSQVREFCRGK